MGNYSRPHKAAEAPFRNGGHDHEQVFRAWLSVARREWSRAASDE
jgi:hypothetical protein